MKPAVFMDRDGTLIEPVHYLSKPQQVALIPGVADALDKMSKAGFALVVVTNQSGIGRGILNENDLVEIHAELTKQLEAFGLGLDGIYHCSVVPKQKEPTVVEHEDRKPGPGMLLRASSELGLDLTRSWMVGDTLADIYAGRNAGCKGQILVRTGYGGQVDAQAHAIEHVIDSLADADRIILKGSAANP